MFPAQGGLPGQVSPAPTGIPAQVPVNVSGTGQYFAQPGQPQPGYAAAPVAQPQPQYYGQPNYYQQQQYAPAPQYQAPYQPVVLSQPAPAVAPTPPAQPQANQIDEVINAVAQHTGRTAEFVRKELGDNPAGSIGKMIGRAVEVLSQSNRQTQPGQPQQPGQQPAALPPGQVQYDADGRFVLPPGSQTMAMWDQTQNRYVPTVAEMPHIAAYLNHNLRIDQEKSRQLQTNPGQLLQHPDMQKMIKDEVEQQYQQKVLDKTISDFRAKHLPDMMELDQNGQPVKDLFNGQVKMKPFGVSLLKHMERLQNEGMRPGETLLEQAKLAAQQEVGQVFTQQQPQQQRGQPMSSMILGHGQQFQGQPNLQGHAYLPGQQGGQPNQYAQHLQPATSLDGMLHQMMANDPENMPIGFYLERHGPSLFGGPNARASQYAGGMHIVQ